MWWYSCEMRSVSTVSMVVDRQLEPWIGDRNVQLSLFRFDTQGAKRDKKREIHLP
jgi:hypothetical protein